MNTTQTRGKVVGAARRAVVAGAAATTRRSQKMLIAAALVLGAILLAPSPTVAHAAPLGLHVSENPVHFGPFETKNTITITWSPPETQVELLVKASNGHVVILPVQPGPYGGWLPIPVDVNVGETLTIWVRNIKPPYEQSPSLEITTVQPIELCANCGAPPLPRADINPTLTPKPGPFGALTSTRIAIARSPVLVGDPTATGCGASPS